MRLKAILVLCLLMLISRHAYANDGEEFKDICSRVAKDFAEVMSFDSAEDVPADLDKKTNEDVALLVKQLKRFVQLNPDSIWADDAHFILSVFQSGYPHQEASELEYLLEKYPDMHIEDWTKENFSWMIPKADLLPIDVRIRLLLYYKKFGEESKLNALLEESIKKFPEKAQLFEQLIKKLSTSD